MKSISKLGLVSTLSLCLVIGGVYATWNYAQGNISDASVEPGIGLESATDTLAEGTISITNNATFSIDDANGDYYGEMVVEGSITVTFTAAAGASADVYNNGIDLKVTFALPSENSYAFYTNAACTSTESKQVFKLGSTEMIIDTDDFSVSGNGVFTYTISTTKLQNIFKLAETSGKSNVYLPTHSAYTAFNDDFMFDANFTITVGDGRDS